MDPRLIDIFSRRSIRAYQNKEVPLDQVEAVLQAAMAAPSACCKDPWKFVVIRNKETLSKISEALPNGKMLASASVGIVVCGEIAAAHDGQISYLLQDCSAAIENLLLAVNGLSLGACWLGIHPRVERMNSVSKILGLPSGIIPVACISIGVPSEKKEARTRYNASSVHWEKW